MMHALGAIQRDRESGGASPNRVKFTAEAGQNYYFKVSPAWSSAGWDIEPLDETNAREMVTNYTLSGDSRFELLKEQTPK